MRLFALLLVPALLGAQSLRGSGKKIAHENSVADKEHLSKIKNNSMLERFVVAGLLVPIPDGTHGLVIDSRLEEDRRVCRPFAVQFLKDLGDSVQKKFHRPLQINSCTRDSVTQAELRETNKNAAPVAGSHASLHLRGNTVDIRRLGVPKDEQKYVESRLKALAKLCKIDPTRESVQKVWHVVVYKAYMKKGSACAKPQKKPRSKK